MKVQTSKFGKMKSNKRHFAGKVSKSMNLDVSSKIYEYSDVQRLVDQNL